MSERVKDGMARAIVRIPIRTWNMSERVKDGMARAIVRIPIRTWNMDQFLVDQVVSEHC